MANCLSIFTIQILQSIYSNENAKIKSKKYMNAKIANHNHLNRLSTDITVNQEATKTSFLAKTQPRASWAGLKGY